MDISFQGFYPELPYSIYVVILLLSLVLSWWSYRHFKSISPVARYGLVVLRGLVFFILLSLLANPLFETQSTAFIKSNISVFLDNSRSITVNKGRYEGEETYKEVMTHLNFASIEDADLTYFTIEENLASARPDTLKFNASETNLYEALNQIQANRDNTQAAILLSDGIYTSGQDPSYLSQKLQTPVYVVGLGDTVRVNDLVVKNIVTSNKGYTQTEHSVETTIINDGFSGEQATVQLISGDRIIASQTLSFTEPKSAHTLEFSIPLQEEGLHQYRIHIPKLENEWTDANNEKTFSVDVRSNRDRILHVAFEIHPDVKAVRSILASDKNISLINRTWIGGRRFLKGELPTGADTLDLLILHGYPRKDIPKKIQNEIISLADELPVIFVNSPGSNLLELPSVLNSMLPVTIEKPVKSLRAGIYSNQSQREHAVMELPGISYSDLPSIYAPIRNVKKAPAATSLFNVRYRGSQTDVPFLAVQQIGNKRSSIMNGYGYYRWNQYHEKSIRSFVTRLWINLVSWNAADTEDKLLRVEPAQQVFDGDDNVRLNAFLRNESGQREADASIDITVRNSQMGEKQYVMENEGNGKYSLNLGTLAEGIYQFNASAFKGDKSIDTYQGEFSVSSTNIEYVNTTRNDQLLRQIAEQSGGEFYDFSNADSLWIDMRKAGLLDQTRKVSTRKYYPYQHALWFIMVVILLGAEWLLRKYFALP